MQTPLAFLYAMTRRVAIDMYRHEKHSLPLPPDWMHRYGATDDGRNYRLWELECSIQESLSQEPPRMREALIRHVLYGERVIDLSRELAINAATLRQRFHRMIKKLPKDLLVLLPLFPAACKVACHIFACLYVIWSDGGMKI